MTRHTTVLYAQMFPTFAGEVRDFDNGIRDAHAVFATSWQTTYPLFACRSAGRQALLFRPGLRAVLLPVGSQASSLRTTYRIGYHGVTAGGWLARKLAAEYGMPSDAFDLGCDTQRHQPRMVHGTRSLHATPTPSRVRTGRPRAQQFARIVPT